MLAGCLRRAGRKDPVPGPDVTDPWQAVDQRLDAASPTPALRRAPAELPVTRQTFLSVGFTDKIG